MDMIEMKKNNELAKPMTQNTDDIYAKQSPSPNYEGKYDGPNQNYQSNNYPIQQKVIVIQNPQNERPIDWMCFGQDSLQNKARMNFIRKVYLLLAFQLLITIGFCCLSYFVKPFFEFQMTYWWVVIIVIVFMYAIMGVILCSERYRQFPHNIVWLTLFTLCFSYMISQVTSAYAYYYGGPLVLTAAALTLFMVLGMTLFAIFSRNDLNMLFGVIIILLFSFGGFGLMCIFTLSPVIYQLYCAIAVAIMGILLIIDTKLIIGGQKSISISMDNYILGSLILYIDIMRIFLLILQLLGASRR